MFIWITFKKIIFLHTEQKSHQTGATGTHTGPKTNRRSRNKEYQLDDKNNHQQNSISTKAEDLSGIKEIQILNL